MRIGPVVAALLLLGVPPCFGAQPTSTTAPIATRPAATQKSSEEVKRRRVHVFVTGRVQGVGFRAFTQEEARKLRLRGYVLNRADGSVEAVVEGPSADIERLLELLKRGPQGARVDKVSGTDETYASEFADFEIRAE